MSTFAELKALGAFVDGEPVQKSISFKLDGDDAITATIFVKKLSVGESERIFLASGADKESRTAKMIAELVLLGDGSERLSFQDAYKLHPRIAQAMIQAIGEVNGLTDQPKN